MRQSDAEDIAQEALIKVHWRMGEFRNDGRAEFTTWVFKIARNQAIDFHRAQRPKLQELPEDEEPLPTNGHLAGRNTDLLEWLKGALSNLPAENQQILLERAQEFSFAEIGRGLGMKEGTARVRYSRAIKKLTLADNLPQRFRE